MRPPRRVLAALCVTEVVSWGVLYYAFPVALASITADTGWSASATTAAFSGGLVVSALAGIPVGRWLDRFGPRRVMTAGSLLAAPAAGGDRAGADAWPGSSPPGWSPGWPWRRSSTRPAFAALTRWYGPGRVRALTTLTLVAGLASTIFAPLTSLLLDHLSWRATYLVLAVVLAVVTVPLHALALTPPWTAGARAPSTADGAPALGAVDRAQPRLPAAVRGAHRHGVRHVLGQPDAHPAADRAGHVGLPGRDHARAAGGRASSWAGSATPR